MRLLRKTGEEDGLLGQSVLKSRGAGSALDQPAVLTPAEERNRFMNGMIRVPRAAEEIVEKLNSRGFEAYVVGGCVRDSLLRKEPEDWDITTSAKPEQVKAVFGRTIDTGIKHGTVTILRGGKGYEVTTFRIDGEYEDGRHPRSVEFTTSLTEDLKRRDFTVNAMAYSRQTGLVDVFGGLKDLEEHRICCVGNAYDRFTEDALRMLRALRFSAQLGFAIEEKTEAALRELAPNLRNVSKERVQAELTKLLLSDRPETVRNVFLWGLASCVSETFAGMDADRIVISSRLPAVKHMRWAACLGQLPARQAVKVLRELKLDNDTISRVRTLSEWRNRPVGIKEADIRRTMSRMSPELFDDLLTMKEAAAEPSNKQSEAASADPIPESVEDLEKIRNMTKQIRSRGDCISLKMLAVTGADLIAAGMKPGRDMGRVLEQLLELVLERPELNTRQRLLEEVPAVISKKTT